MSNYSLIKLICVNWIHSEIAHWFIQQNYDIFAHSWIFCDYLIWHWVSCNDKSCVDWDHISLILLVRENNHKMHSKSLIFLCVYYSDQAQKWQPWPWEALLNKAEERDIYSVSTLRHHDKFRCTWMLTYSAAVFRIHW